MRARVHQSRSRSWLGLPSFSRRVVCDGSGRGGRCLVRRAIKTNKQTHEVLCVSYIYHHPKNFSRERNRVRERHRTYPSMVITLQTIPHRRVGHYLFIVHLRRCRGTHMCGANVACAAALLCSHISTSISLCLFFAFLLRGEKWGRRGTAYAS